MSLMANLAEHIRNREAIFGIVSFPGDHPFSVVELREQLLEDLGDAACDPEIGYHGRRSAFFLLCGVFVWLLHEDV